MRLGQDDGLHKSKYDHFICPEQLLRARRHAELQLRVGIVRKLSKRLLDVRP
jgi:hypothetical protein